MNVARDVEKKRVHQKDNINQGLHAPRLRKAEAASENTKFLLKAGDQVLDEIYRLLETLGND